MQLRTTRLGGLTCRIVEGTPGSEPQLVVVFCHGFGAPGTDLLNLAPQLAHIKPRLDSNVQFLFPEAPLAPQELYGGRAWWPIDMMRLMTAIETGEIRKMRCELPEGLPEARERLLALVDEASRETGLPVSRFVLGGFSQGSMVTTDVMLRLRESTAAHVIFSGTLLCENEWQPLAAKRGPMTVLQSHGSDDPILPYEAAEWLRDLLANAGMNVDFIPFPGVHEIPYEALHRCAALLEGLLE